MASVESDAPEILHTGEAAPAGSGAESPPAVEQAESPATEPSLHYVGVLTAPVDEAELDIADALAARSMRGRRIGWAIAALLIMPSLIAATVYALEHRDKVERLIAYARAFIPTPVGSAPSTQPDVSGAAPASGADSPVADSAVNPPGDDRAARNDTSIQTSGERDSTSP